MRRRQWHPTPVLLPGKSHGWRSLVGCSPWGRKGRTWLGNLTFTFHFHALEKKMATHSSVLAWRIPGTGEPGGLPSMGSHRVGHDWSDLAAAGQHCEGIINRSADQEQLLASTWLFLSKLLQPGGLYQWHLPSQTLSPSQHSDDFQYDRWGQTEAKPKN